MTRLFCITQRGYLKRTSPLCSPLIFSVCVSASLKHMVGEFLVAKWSLDEVAIDGFLGKTFLASDEFCARVDKEVGSVGL